MNNIIDYQIEFIFLLYRILCCCVRFQLLKYRGTENRQQSGGATGRGRMGTMAQGAMGVRAHVGYSTETHSI